MKSEFQELLENEIHRIGETIPNSTYQEGKTKAQLVQEFARLRGLIDSTATNRYSNPFANTFKGTV